MDFSTLTEDIRRATAELRKNQTDEQAHTALLNEAKALVHALEQPPDILTRVAIVQPSQFLCIRLAIDLGLFELLSKTSPQHVSQLAQASGAEDQLVLRIVRTLAAAGIIAEAGPSLFEATSVSNHLTRASVRAGLIHWFDQGLPSIAATPAYFKNNKYQSPPTCTSGPLQYANNTELETYQYWQTKPGVAENFHTFMTGHFGGKRIHWSSWFPQEDEIIKKFDSSKSPIVFVDVGGGSGREVNALRTKFSDVQGRFILQDLPVVLEETRTTQKLDERLELVDYDFFKPEPLKGAFVYFLSNILHNWPDNESLKIVKNIADAMTPGYSRLFICDMVLPDTGCSEDGSGFDIGMMYLHSGMQRSEGQWAELFEKAGLKLAKVWRGESSNYSAIVEGVKEA